jgi:DNA-binding SARP family transcriptional activator
MVRLDENCDAARIALTGALLAENAARAEELLALAQKTFSWWESADDFITLALYRAALYARSDLPTGRTDRFAEALGAFLAEAEKGKYEPAQAGERALAARVLNQAAGKGLLSGYGEKLRALVAGEGRAEAGSRTIRIFSFGKFRVHVGGNLVGAKDWKTRKSEYLLAFLASRGHAASEEKIIDTFWPDSAPDKAKQSLYTAVSYVKDALRNPHAVEKGRGFYSFNRNLSYRLDTEEFDLACREGAKMEAEGRRDEAAALYRNAESLCTGEFLEGYSEDWAVELREHYCVRHLDLIMRLAEHYHERQKFDVSVAYCQKALEQDPLHQGAFLLLMRSYNSLGRNEEVVRVYQRCCKVLKDELNIAPSMDIINLYVRAGA